MNYGVSTTSQGKLLDTARTKPLTNRRDRAHDVSSTKRKFDVTSEADPLSLKKARFTRTDAQWPREANEKSKQVDKTALQQPKGTYASSLAFEAGRPEPPATRLRKRPTSSSSGGDRDGDSNKHPLNRVRLTRKNLALFDKMAKKKGTNKTSVSAPLNSTVGSSTTQTVSTTSSGFAEQAYQNGILLPRHSKPPKNIEDIRERFARSRASPSPTESEFNRYVNNVEVAKNEATMIFRAGGKLLKEYDDKSYYPVLNQAFTGFPKNVGFNNGLSTPQPDFIEGLERREYNPLPIDKHVNGAILYKDDPLSLVLPHLAGEWKGRGKDIEKARLQSAYDGAALVYARNQALSYIGKPDPPGHAEVTTFATDGTNLNVFVHYATLEGGTLEYHQYPVGSINLTNSHQGLKEGRRGLRNEQDHSRKQSYALRDQMKEDWEHRGRDLHSIAEGDSPPVLPGELTNVYEDQYEGETSSEIIEQPNEPILPTSSKLEGLSGHGETSSSHSSSKSLPPANDYGSGNHTRKRKASLSSQVSSNKSSRHKSH